MPTDRARHRARRVAGGIDQLPWRQLVNPYRPLEILSADQVETIHRASLRILAELGMQVWGDRALDLLRSVGAEVDLERKHVRLEPGLVESLVARAPARFASMPGTRPAP